jgi:nicotinamide-nucleotide adenylyltransferase
MTLRDEDRGLLAGRFQPFHKGHETAIADALGTVAEVIVGVSSIDANLTLRDPFTCGERLEMVCRSLDDDVRRRCLVIPLPDHPNNRLWSDYVLQYLPRFTMAFTNNPLQRLTLALKGIPVRPLTLYRRETHQGRVIRGMLGARNPAWRDFVPAGTALVLDEISAESRLEALGLMAYGAS